MTTTYSNKANAIRAARNALATKYPSGALSGVHFKIRQVGEDWLWGEVDQMTGQLIGHAHVVEKPALDPAFNQVGAAVGDSVAKSRGDIHREHRQGVKDARAALPDRVQKARVSTATAQLDKAKAGALPEPPAFISPSALPYQRRLDPLIAAAKAGDIKALKAAAVDANSKDGRVAAMGRYRDLAVVAIEARAS